MTPCESRLEARKQERERVKREARRISAEEWNSWKAAPHGLWTAAGHWQRVERRLAALLGLKPQTIHVARDAIVSIRAEEARRMAADPEVQVHGEVAVRG